MTKKLPVGNFRWFETDDTEKIMELIRDGKHHDIEPSTLRVDLSHDPKNIEMEKIFTMCPEFLKGKLSHTLFEKKNYIVHHRALKKYIDYGMKVMRVDTGIFYDEKDWMKGYMEYCVENRKIAKSNGVESLVQFWKDMMNQPYGKTIENVRNRIDFQLVNNKEKLQKLARMSSFQDETVFANDDDGFLLGVHMTQQKVTLDKPIYTGQCVLDDSKILMYDFIYNYCMKKWPGKFKVCQTDTDSVICEIETEDIMSDIKDDIEKMFDTSSLVRTKFDGTEIPRVNNKVLGMMSDELGGQFMIKFVGIGPKNYSYMYLKLDGTEDSESVCKGVLKCVHPEFNEYEHLMLNMDDGESIEKTCTRISSKNHCVKTVDVTKIALTKELRKRVRDEINEFETLPYGYFELKENE